MNLLNAIGDSLKHISLTFDVGMFQSYSAFDSLLKYVVPITQGHPFHSGHELIDDFVYFVSVSYASHVDLNVIFSNQRLGR